MSLHGVITGDNRGDNRGDLRFSARSFQPGFGRAGVAGCEPCCCLQCGQARLSVCLSVCAWVTPTAPGGQSHTNPAAPAAHGAETPSAEPCNWSSLRCGGSDWKWDSQTNQGFLLTLGYKP